MIVKKYLKYILTPTIILLISYYSYLLWNSFKESKIYNEHLYEEMDIKEHKFFYTSRELTLKDPIYIICSSGKKYQYLPEIMEDCKKNAKNYDLNPDNCINFDKDINFIKIKYAKSCKDIIKSNLFKEFNNCKSAYLTMFGEFYKNIEIYSNNKVLFENKRNILNYLPNNISNPIILRNDRIDIVVAPHPDKSFPKIIKKWGFRLISQNGMMLDYETYFNEKNKLMKYMDRIHLYNCDENL